MSFSQTTPIAVPIAVVGISALFPGSNDVGGFWRDIVDGKDQVRDVPPTHWLIEDYYDADPSAPDKTYGKRGAFLGDVDFDALGFGVPPSVIPATDTCQLLALVVAQKLLDDVGAAFDEVDREKISVILGVTSAQELLGSMVSRLQRPVWVKGLRDAGIPEDKVQEACDRISAEYVPWQESTFPGVLGNVVAGRIANRLDLHGTNCVTDAACASSLSALSMAVNELAVGQSDLALAGGADTMNDIFMYMCFSKTPALSKTGDCRPFSDRADGTLLGEGIGMVALKRLADAERDGNHIYGVIRGVGSSSDGRAKSVYAPVPEGQARALRRAYEAAGYSPRSVELVEAHGTGTVAGDAAEFKGLEMVFGEGEPSRNQWCAIGSIKSQIGHTKAAAGVAGLMKAVLALHHRVLPPSIKIDRPNPEMDLPNSPFYLSTQARPWVRDDAHPRRASVSSFGFGGSNFHVAIEEYGGECPAPRRAVRSGEVVLLHAADAAGLVSAAEDLREAAGDLRWLAWCSQRDFDPRAPARAALVVEDRADLLAKLGHVGVLAKGGDGVRSAPNGVHVGLGSGLEGIAGMFPGQGSQYLYMGDRVLMDHHAALAVWDRAASRCADFAERVDAVVYPPPALDEAARQAQVATLTDTRWAQPGIGLASLAMLEVVRGLGVSLDRVGGHSFGEVTALHAAGVLSEEDFVAVATQRGALMSAAAQTDGAMSAVPASADVVREVLAAAGAPGVVLANLNHPNQQVISGPTAGVALVEQALVDRGIQPKRLPVATAFHSRVVSDSVEPFSAFLEGIDMGVPQVDVYANSQAAPYPADADGIRAILGGQIAEPVRFAEQVEAMYAAGCRIFLEIGPGSVLTGLVGRCLGDRPHLAISMDRKGRDPSVSLLEAVAQLAAAGVDMAFESLWNGQESPVDPADASSPKLAIPLNGANYGKPYPPPGGAASLPGPNPEPAPAPAPAPAAPAPAPAAHAAPLPSPAAHAAPVAPGPQAYAAPVPAAAPAPVADNGWVAAFQDAQRQTAEAHAAYQHAMAESHMAFLQTVEASLQGLTAMMTGAPMPVARVAAMPAMPAAPMPAAPMPAPMPAPAPVVAGHAPVPPVAPVVTPAPAPVPAVAAAPAAPALDLEALMLETVAEKTGYPPEMLQMDMALESDLGVDSIKRVEILSAVRERAPELPDVDPGELGSLRTLGEVVERLRASAPASMTRAAPAAAPVAAPGLDLRSLLLGIVADKTGYPVEMLGMDMALESDLGIDSIKRVEILSALREKAPELPEVDASEMASLHTLGEIVASMDGALPASGSSTVAAPATSTGPVSVDIAGLLLDVVAEKTGYPAEMVGLDMGLESDLGIDSIKRVEILSAMRERAPNLPEVDAAAMAGLGTLGAIVAWLEDRDMTPGSAVEEAAPSAVASGVGRWVVGTAPSAAVGLGATGLEGTVAVTDDGSGVASALVAALRAGGVDACLATDGGDHDAWVALDGLAPGGADEAEQAVWQVFRAARASGGRLKSFVTVQDTGGDFGVSGSERAWFAGVAGITRCAAQEWPDTVVRALDIEVGGRDAEAVASQIAAELLAGGPELEVGLRADGRRVTPVCIEAEVLPAEGRTLDEGAVVVVSGGARGVTAACGIELARAIGARLVLLGRTPLADEPAQVRGVVGDAALKRALAAKATAAGEKITPAELGAQARRIQAAREVRATLDAVSEAGGEARYVAVDVRDAAALGKILDAVRADWGPIQGVVHGAGVIADKALVEKTDEQFERVWQTKVRGLRALLEATESDPLRLLCMFSSIAARTGNNGQADYAAANEVLNKVVAQRQREGLRAVSIGWGPWRGGMVDPALEAHFHAMGVPLIPLEEGAQRFVAEVLGDGPAEVIVGGPPDQGLRATKSQRPSATLHLRLGAATHGYLRDHSVRGVPVVPLVLVHEWFLKAALCCRPDLVPVGSRELRVFRGVRLERFDEAVESFTVSCRELSNGDGSVLACELHGADGTPHYAATVELARALPRPVGGALPTVDEPAWPEVVYGDGGLFHGPDFHVLDVEGVGEANASAMVSGVIDKGWSGEWLSDAAVLDGGLQLALLHARVAVGGASLPTGFEVFQTYTTGPVTGPVRCVLVGRADGKKTVTDMRFAGEDGQVLFEIRGLQTHQYAGADAPAVTSAAKGLE